MSGVFGVFKLITQNPTSDIENHNYLVQKSPQFVYFVNYIIDFKTYVQTVSVIGNPLFPCITHADLYRNLSIVGVLKVKNKL